MATFPRQTFSGASIVDLMSGMDKGNDTREIIQTVICKYLPVPCSNEKDFYGKSDLASLSPRRDLNSRPLVYKTSALTPELRRLTELCILH